MPDESERDESAGLHAGRPSDPQAIAELADRRAEAWRLRVDEGRTYADIAMLMGVSQSTACSYVQHVLASKAPADEDVEAYRAQLIGTAMARSELAFERADQLYADAGDQSLVLEGPRGGVIVSTLAPQLYGRAAAWEQRGLHHLDRVARWSGVEALRQDGPDADALEESIVAEAERLLDVVDQVRSKREAAAASLATVGDNAVADPHLNGSVSANGMG